MKFLVVLPFLVGAAFAYSSGAPSCDVEMPGHKDDNGEQIEFQPEWVFEFSKDKCE